MTDRPIIVGYDGSLGAREALDFGIHTAEARDLGVEVVFASWPGLQAWSYVTGYGGPPEQELLTGAAKIVDEALDLASHTGVSVVGKVVEGLPSSTLLSAAERGEMIVVGSRGLGGFGDLLLGSTGVQLASHAPCPTVVVRPQEPNHAAGAEAGRVVVGLDGSAESEAALEFALQQASSYGVGLTAIRALDFPRFGIAAPVPGIPPEFWSEASTAQRAELEQTIESWRGKYPDVHIKTVVRLGNPSQVLLQASLGSRLLVVGSRGLGGFRLLLLGSVSHSLLHHGHGPIAVIRS